MNTVSAITPRDDSRFVHKEVYYKPEYVSLEKERLWPRVWQMACREEELREVGAYVTYDIYDESVIVVRQADNGIGAFYNVCQHRGRRLAEGCGTTKRFRCKFHGWQYELNGKNCHVTQRTDWHGLLDDVDIALKPVRVDVWGGFVFVNLNPNAEPLREYLESVPDALGPFELEKMRYGWRKWLVMPCNWKIALEAFNEGYHVAITHNQLNQWGAPHYSSSTFGKHAMFGAASETGTLAMNTSKEQHPDLRGSLGDFYRYMKRGLASLMTDTIVQQASRLKETLPAGTPPEQVIEKLTQMSIEADAARGVEWPSISAKEYQLAGVDWHIFPNMVLLPMATNCLGYRARPNGDDPDSCIFEVYHLERFPADPTLPESIRNDDIYDEGFWGEILLQDFQQMQATHKGIKSYGFKGPRTNPTQETPITNFHRVYGEYLNRPPTHRVPSA
jgi:phenylpropionate dioxygenase-like ring-hydroxylating dioxygenase large terminal subunit